MATMATNNEMVQNPEVLSWTNTIKTRILQFYNNSKIEYNFKTPKGIKQMSIVYGQLMQDLLLHRSTPTQETNRRIFLVQLYKFIGYMREIYTDEPNDETRAQFGKYTLAHMMIWHWFQHYPRLAENAISQIVCCTEEQGHPYGSWKDIKYMCNYFRDQITDENQDPAQHPLIRYTIQLLTAQLKFDLSVYESTDPNDKYTMSLASKWSPRETSQKFGWLYPHISGLFYREYMITAHQPASIVQAQKKCNAQFRMMIARLNRHLDTVQIKQCAGRWSEIVPEAITTTTMMRQREAFMNIMNGCAISAIRSQEPDRIQCAEQLVPFYEEQLRKLDERIANHAQKNAANVEEPGDLENKWNAFTANLQHPRYKIMEDKMREKTFTM